MAVQAVRQAVVAILGARFLGGLADPEWNGAVGGERPPRIRPHWVCAPSDTARSNPESLAQWLAERGIDALPFEGVVDHTGQWVILDRRTGLVMGKRTLPMGFQPHGSAAVRNGAHRLLLRTRIIYRDHPLFATLDTETAKVDTLGYSDWLRPDPFGDTCYTGWVRGGRTSMVLRDSLRFDCGLAVQEAVFDPTGAWLVGWNPESRVGSTYSLAGGGRVLLQRRDREGNVMSHLETGLTGCVDAAVGDGAGGVAVQISDPRDRKHSSLGIARFPEGFRTVPLPWPDVHWRLLAVSAEQVLCLADREFFLLSSQTGAVVNRWTVDGDRFGRTLNTLARGYFLGASRVLLELGTRADPAEDPYGAFKLYALYSCAGTPLVELVGWPGDRLRSPRPFSVSSPEVSLLTEDVLLFDVPGAGVALYDLQNRAVPR
ncbi:MAG: hypothetical protein IPK72_25620 [Candidatus Eisenbacteria bacterium]|nr:hypothetical protein [Candidatus Eisenbacteria bacterium]